VPKEQNSLLFRLLFSLLGLDPLLPHPKLASNLCERFLCPSFTFLGCAFRLSDKSTPCTKSWSRRPNEKSPPPPPFQCEMHTVEKKIIQKNYRNIAFLPAEERQKLVLSFLIISTLLISQKMRYTSNQIRGNLRGRTNVIPLHHRAQTAETQRMLSVTNCRDFRKPPFLMPELPLDSPPSSGVDQARAVSALV